MVYTVPNKEKENWEKEYQVKQGCYLCWQCNQKQKIETLIGYLEPCKKCGCKSFYGF